MPEDLLYAAGGSTGTVHMGAARVPRILSSNARNVT